MNFFHVASILIIGFASVVNGTLYVNEVLADNENGIQDENDQNEDWLELYNDSDMEVDLTGYFLTDDEDALNEWAIPDGTTIEPFGFLLFWCDDDEDEGPLHTNFKLSKDGETVYLVFGADEIVSSLEFPEIDEDLSYGRVPDGSSLLQVFSNPTPASPNVPDNLTLSVVKGSDGSSTIYAVGATANSNAFYLYDTTETTVTITGDTCNGTTLGVNPAANRPAIRPTNSYGTATLQIPFELPGIFYIQVVDGLACEVSDVVAIGDGVATSIPSSVGTGTPSPSAMR